MVRLVSEQNNTAYLSSGVNFINVLTSYFYARRSQKRKKLLNLTVFFALLGSARVKAACRMMVKLTPGVNTTKLFLLNIKLGHLHFLQLWIDYEESHESLPFTSCNILLVFAL